MSISNLPQAEAVLNEAADTLEHFLHFYVKIERLNQKPESVNPFRGVTSSVYPSMQLRRDIHFIYECADGAGIIKFCLRLDTAVLVNVTALSCDWKTEFLTYAKDEQTKFEDDFGMVPIHNKKQTITCAVNRYIRALWRAGKIQLDDAKLIALDLKLAPPPVYVD